ncbi:hypothetical protein PTTG_30364 [Puccinia triticina 1-1 BBBD Race 1]|uniref:Aspartic peptidase DDI1-type domain-containing protein n=1 Tax=Puccinia triticina (isolate 1-1 / race 1 (BBBD)) TaxID=630390 RepID=A0A180G1D5_PUCT1|nr:hypothetical protein PTTG_30364 [Puccinia triticina 1-1 BBBD Race 1]
MQKIEQDRRPKAPATSENPPVTVDDISKMLQSFEQRIEKKFSSAAVPSGGASSSKERGPMTFSGTYEADPARRKHEAPRPYKAPTVPPSAARRPAKKATAPDAGPDAEGSDMEEELFERTPAAPPADSVPMEDVPAESPAKPPTISPKVRFERGVTKDHPNAVEGMLKKVFDLSVPNVTVSELLAVAPSVAEGMKKWVSRRRVEIGSEELKVSSGTLAEGLETAGNDFEPRLYSCPLGYLACLAGDEESNVSPLVDSGSQLNLISDAMANKLNISLRVNFTSAVYGIGNQACELVGIAEDVHL